MDMRQKTVMPLSVGEHLSYFQALLPGERGLLLAQELPLHPWELYLLPLGADGAGEPVCLTHLYDDRLAEFTWSEPERVKYRGSNNDEIGGWLIRPVGAREGVRYPLLLAIHGGPQWAFGVGVDNTFQYFGAQCVRCFYFEPHGSTGCQQTFLHGY